MHRNSSQEKEREKERADCIGVVKNFNAGFRFFIIQRKTTCFDDLEVILHAIYGTKIFRFYILIKYSKLHVM